MQVDTAQEKALAYACRALPGMHAPSCRVLTRCADSAVYCPWVLTLCSDSVCRAENRRACHFVGRRDVLEKAVGFEPVRARLFGSWSQLHDNVPLFEKLKLEQR
eukprot:scaffold15909_cov19-Tisochrysis_lutea.AAC.2